MSIRKGRGQSTQESTADHHAVAAALAREFTHGDDSPKAREIADHASELASLTGDTTGSFSAVVMLKGILDSYTNPGGISPKGPEKAQATKAYNALLALADVHETQAQKHQRELSGEYTKEGEMYARILSHKETPMEFRKFFSLIFARMLELTKGMGTPHPDFVRAVWHLVRAELDGSHPANADELSEVLLRTAELQVRDEILEAARVGLYESKFR